MGVLRLLAIAALVLVVLWLLRRLGQGRGDGVPRRPSDAATPSAPADTSLPLMVACARCGVHLPAADALPGPAGAPGRAYYCCAAHRDGPPA